jgi:ferritin-like protein
MLHEERSKLSPRTQDMKRAIDSLREELEAVDWYQQRVDAVTDEQLKKILVHNMDEEKEHAMMLLEWIRQHDVVFNKEIQHYVGKENPNIASLDKKVSIEMNS